MKFNPGYLVRALKNATGQYTKGKLYTVRYQSGDMVYTMTDDSGSKSNGFGESCFELAYPQGTLTLCNPSIADDLRLTPQGRKILGHLKRGLTISPLEAQNVYAVYRLAGRIHEIRGAGYKVKTQFKADACGHRYARYSLAAA